MEFSQSIINKIRAIISVESEKATGGDLKAEGAINILEKLENWIDEQVTKLEKKAEEKKNQIQEFMVHGKAYYYDISTKAPVFDNLTRIIKANDKKSAELKFKEEIKEIEKGKIEPQKVFTRVEVEKTTLLSKGD